MPTNQNIFAAFAGGCVYAKSNDDASRVQKNIPLLRASGLNTLILGLFHIGRDFEVKQPQILGDIYFNDTLVFSQGKYVGYGTNPGDSTSWPLLLKGVEDGGSISQLAASIGGASDVIYDFRAIDKIYKTNNKSFQGTNLQRNFAKLRQVLPMVSIIDMDNEETDPDNRESFTAFCKMLVELGFSLTFCPFTDQDFWTSSLKAVSSSRSGPVRWWNLQAYAGGTGNDPQQWAQTIRQALPSFDTARYIVGSDWTRFYNTITGQWEGDFPFNSKPGSSVYLQFQPWANEPAVGGGFFWNADQVLSYEADNKKYGPDPDYDPSGGSLSQYVTAMAKALGGQAL